MTNKHPQSATAVRAVDNHIWRRDTLISIRNVFNNVNGKSSDEYSVSQRNAAIRIFKDHFKLIWPEGASVQYTKKAEYVAQDRKESLTEKNIGKFHIGSGTYLDKFGGGLSIRLNDAKNDEFISISIKNIIKQIDSRIEEESMIVDLMQDNDPQEIVDKSGTFYEGSVPEISVHFNSIKDILCYLPGVLKLSMADVMTNIMHLYDRNHPLSKERSGDYESFSMRDWSVNHINLEYSNTAVEQKIEMKLKNNKIHNEIGIEILEFGDIYVYTHGMEFAESEKKYIIDVFKDIFIFNARFDKAAFQNFRNDLYNNSYLSSGLNFNKFRKIVADTKKRFPIDSGVMNAIAKIISEELLRFDSNHSLTEDFQMENNPASKLLVVLDTEYSFCSAENDTDGFVNIKLHAPEWYFDSKSINNCVVSVNICPEKIFCDITVKTEDGSVEDLSSVHSPLKGDAYAYVNGIFSSIFSFDESRR